MSSIVKELKEKADVDVIVTTGRWHTNIRQKYGFSITDTESGCGSMILSGYKNCAPKTFSKILEIVKPHLIEDGVGALITTLGQDFPKLMIMLDENGFEKLIEYPNYRHGCRGDYKQYLYIKKL